MEGYRASKIFAVDTDREVISECRTNIELLNNRQFRECISYHSICLGCNAGESRIDQVFGSESLTLINMDVEGAETNVIKSAENVIINDRPVMAICVYHKPEDIFQIIMTLRDICRDYHFYLRKYPNYPFHRYNSKEELVLYAIPEERQA